MLLQYEYVWVCFISGGGISSYADHPGAAGRSLEDCLNLATKEIPKARHRLTPVYLGATAGMRLLKYECVMIMCVCVCVSEKERARDRETESVTVHLNYLLKCSSLCY